MTQNGYTVADLSRAASVEALRRSPICMELTYKLGDKVIPCGLPFDTHGPFHCGEFGYCRKYLNGHVLILHERGHRIRTCACGASTFEDVPFGQARCCVEAAH